MAAPTFPAAADLVEGTGTRSFTAVTTAANDWLVVEIVVELGIAGTPAMSPLTWTQQNDRDDGTGRTEVFQFTAQDTVGGSRTIQLVPGTTAKYRARLTVVRGSTGPGTGKGTAAAQTVSVTRQAANSAMFMTVGDWAAGAVGSPAWTPGGATQASQQGTAATYVFGRWNDSGATATASHGVSSPAYGTPSIAVLEMLGTAGGGATVAPDGIAVPVTPGDPTLTWSGSVAPDGIAASVSLGSPTAAAQSIAAPDGVAVPVALGSPSLVWSAGVAPDGLSVPVALGAPIVGAASVDPGGITVPVGVGDPTLTWSGSIGPVGIAVPVVLGAPIIGVAPFAPVGLSVPVALGSPSLAWSAVVSSDGIFVPVVMGSPSLNISGGVVTRPDSGIVVRPVAGVIVRPNTGPVVRPSSGLVARPDTGAVVRP